MNEANQVPGQQIQSTSDQNQVNPQNLVNSSVNPTIAQPPVKKEEKLYGAVSYVPFFGLFTLLFYPTSAFVRLHVRQGQFLFLLFFAANFFNLILLILKLDLLSGFLSVIFSLSYFFLMIYSMYLAFSGVWWKIPFLGQLSELLPIDLIAKFAKDNVPGEIQVAKDDYQNRQETLKAESNANLVNPQVQQPPIQPIDNNGSTNNQNTGSGQN